VGKAVSPVLWQGGWSVSVGVEIDHDLRAKALDFASSRVLQCLHYSKALISHMIHLRENNQWLVEMRFVQEVDVDISNNHVHVVPVLSLGCSLLEIVAFAQVEELKIDRVINVPQRVDIAKSQLHWQATVERVSGSEIHILFLIISFLVI